MSTRWVDVFTVRERENVMDHCSASPYDSEVRVALHALDPSVTKYLITTASPRWRSTAQGVCSFGQGWTRTQAAWSMHARGSAKAASMRECNFFYGTVRPSHVYAALDRGKKKKITVIEKKIPGAT